MKIQGSILGYSSTLTQSRKAIAGKKTNEGEKNDPNPSAGKSTAILKNSQGQTGFQPQDTFNRSGQNQVSDTAGYDSYDRSEAVDRGIEAKTLKPDSNTLEKLKHESEQAYSHLRDLVRQLLSHQSMTIQGLKHFDGELEVDQQARDEAAAAIADDGPMSAEAVSDRIVAFAKAVSGGDKKHFNQLMAAIDKGFQEAEKILGVTLPEVSQRTRELINQKMDNWLKETHVE